MNMTPYLSFKGDCEAAFKFYEQHLGGQPGPLFRYRGSPMAVQAPPDWQDKVMHASITIGGQTVMGADTVPDQYEVPRGFSLSLNMNDIADAERIFDGLSADGTIIMSLEKTFWAARFGVVVDPFGIQWIVNCEGAD